MPVTTTPPPLLLPSPPHHQGYRCLLLPDSVAPYSHTQIYPGCLLLPDSPPIHTIRSTHGYCLLLPDSPPIHSLRSTQAALYCLLLPDSLAPYSHTRIPLLRSTQAAWYLLTHNECPLCPIHTLRSTQAANLPPACARWRRLRSPRHQTQLMIKVQLVIHLAIMLGRHKVAESTGRLGERSL